MPTFSDTGYGRVIFLDNQRYFLVLCVVLEHACNAYRGLGWWPVAIAPCAVLPCPWLSKQ